VIPYGRQSISEQDIRSVVEVLRSEFITQGPQVPAFEAAVGGYCGARHAVAVNSATSALHLACLALGLGPGDRLWTSPITFVASANCALYCGAGVDFVDIDPVTWNLSPSALARKLEGAREAGALPKIVVPVHLGGQPCEMDAVAELGREYGFSIVEDASHAIGGRYRDEPIGSCRHSDIAVFSFHPVKIVTTAEGGMALTNREELAARMALLRSHGITRDAARLTREPDGPWYYEQVELGFNYRMTELQAALGISQLRRLDEFVAARHRVARRYDRLLRDLPLVTPARSEHACSAMHLYVIRLRPAEIRRSHREVFEHLRRRGIGVSLHYIPVHTQPFYRKLGFRPGDFPEAERYYREAISLPMFPELTESDQDRVVRSIEEALDPP
jgi:UDP-4-amino-4,6-dideoxy-N-acetyl-beta-L-altrosamine transaminase